MHTMRARIKIQSSCFLSALLLTVNSYAAGLETLSKTKPEDPSGSVPSRGVKPAEAATITPPAKPTPVSPAAVTPALVNPKVQTPSRPHPSKEPDAEEDDDDSQAKPVTKKNLKPAPVKSELSKSLDSRLSLGTSLGWAIVKPAKGTWSGLGTSDLSARWRQSRKEDGNLFITARYAPFIGTWTVDKRDYDTTLHGVFGGAELHKPTGLFGDANLKAGVELGYMLVYAHPQDKAKAASDVKGGKVNLAAHGGLEWSLLSDKVKVGPIARVHIVGFSMLNLGGSIHFVF